MAPDIQILTVISSEDKQQEIQRRLQDNETQKARKLLAMATGSHLSALRIMNDQIIKQVMEVKKVNGHNNSSR